MGSCKHRFHPVTLAGVYRCLTCDHPVHFAWGAGVGGRVLIERPYVAPSADEQARMDEINEASARDHWGPR